MKCSTFSGNRAASLNFALCFRAWSFLVAFAERYFPNADHLKDCVLLDFFVPIILCTVICMFLPLLWSTNKGVYWLRDWLSINWVDVIIRLNFSP